MTATPPPPRDFIQGVHLWGLEKNTDDIKLSITLKFFQRWSDFGGLNWELLEAYTLIL